MGLFELVVYAFMFGAFLLFNYVSQQAARRRREQQRREQEALAAQQGYVDDDVVPPTADPLGSGWGRAPEATPFEVVPTFREEAPPVPVRRPAEAPRPVFAAPPRVRQPRTKRHFLRTRQDLRDAVVAMTVLGPCRALQPYDMTGAAPSGSADKAPVR